jgi:hypothetical protein
MSRAEWRLNRALRVTPAADRDRYGSEWRGDLESAAELGISPMEVARGATRAAWQLRLQHWGRNLSGAEGGRRATAAWALVVAILPIPLLFAGPLLLLVIPGSMVVALHLARHNPWRGTDIVMLAALMLWVVGTVAFWWLWGVGFDAADANLPLPDVMKWEGPSFFVGLGAFVTFWAAFAANVIRRASGAARLNGAGQRVTGD